MTDLDSIDVPLHELPQRVVKRARALAGGGSAGIYLTDIEGEFLRRLAGDDDLPEQLSAPAAVGPEFDTASAVRLRAVLRERWPDATIAPLWVLGRALGVLVSTRDAGDGLDALARSMAPMLELASDFTDEVERGRRRKKPSAAAEMQLALLPPRIARVRGGQIVASVLPAYDVGGDWFDHAENPEGVWLAIGDAMGKGIRAAAMSAVSIGALRSARRDGGDPRECAQEMHRAVHDLGANGFVTSVVAFWDAATGRLHWTNCGHLPPVLIRDGSARELTAETTYPLGILERERALPVATEQLRPGDRVLLFSDGVIEARLADGSQFGVERLADILVRSAAQTPLLAVKTVERAVIAASAGEIGDDATQVLLAVDRRR